VSKIDKLWKKFLGGGVVTYPELIRLMAHHGFKELKGRGGSRKFENSDGLQFAMHEPHPGKELKGYQKKGAREFIKEYLKERR